MPVGYQYRTCVNFPDWNEKGESIRITTQPTLLGAEYDTANSEITFLGESDYAAYWKYHIVHEAVRKMTVRFLERIVENVIHVTKFDLYLSKERDHLLVATKESDTNELLKRIRLFKNDFESGERIINLAEMQKAEAMDVGGGWFANLQIADVSSAAVFGVTVVDSDELERYTNSGDISMLYMNYLYGENSYKINVTKNGGVIVMQSLPEHIRLELVEVVSNQLEPYVMGMSIIVCN